MGARRRRTDAQALLAAVPRPGPRGVRLRRQRLADGRSALRLEIAAHRWTVLSAKLRVRRRGRSAHVDGAHGLLRVSVGRTAVVAAGGPVPAATSESLVDVGQYLLGLAAVLFLAVPATVGLDDRSDDVGRRAVSKPLARVAPPPPATNGNVRLGRSPTKTQ